MSEQKDLLKQKLKLSVKMIIDLEYFLKQYCIIFSDDEYKQVTESIHSTQKKFQQSIYLTLFIDLIILALIRTESGEMKFAGLPIEKVPVTIEVSLVISSFLSLLVVIHFLMTQMNTFCAASIIGQKEGIDPIASIVKVMMMTNSSFIFPILKLEIPSEIEISKGCNKYDWYKWINGLFLTLIYLTIFVMHIAIIVIGIYAAIELSPGYFSFHSIAIFLSILTTIMCIFIFVVFTSVKFEITQNLKNMNILDNIQT